MPRPKTTEVRSSVLLATVGGAVGLILYTAVLELGPVLGAARVEPWTLLGGIVCAGPTGATALGYVVEALFLVLVVPAIVATALWPRLPGSPRSLGGALLRGVIVAIALWIIGALLLPAFASLDRFDAGNPGFFAAGAGLGTAVVFLVAHVGYGIVLATLCYLAQGLEPIDAFGWIGVGKRGPRHEPTG